MQSLARTSIQVHCNRRPAKFSLGCPSFGGQRTPGGGSTATFSGRSAPCAAAHRVKPSHGVVVYRNSGRSPTNRPQASCPTPPSSGQTTASRGLPLRMFHKSRLVASDTAQQPLLPSASHRQGAQFSPGRCANYRCTSAALTLG